MYAEKDRFPNADDHDSGEELTLERAEQLARDLGIQPQAMRRVMERAHRAIWYAATYELVFVFYDASGNGQE